MCVNEIMSRSRSTRNNGVCSFSVIGTRQTTVRDTVRLLERIE